MIMEDKPIHNIDISNFKRNPYPDLKEMRAVNPICFVPQVKATMICDRDSIYECEKNTDVFFLPFSLKGLMTILMGQNMMRKDGEDHLKKEKQYSRQSLQKHRGTIGKISLRLLLII